jgi:hypothetical protein
VSRWCIIPGFRGINKTSRVAGGVLAGLSYEFVARPFDVARKTVQLSKLRAASSLDGYPAMVAVLRKVQDDGMSSFFRNPESQRAIRGGSDGISRRVSACLRVLARVGPWGVGFLIFEAFGPGLA